MKQNTEFAALVQTQAEELAQLRTTAVAPAAPQPVTWGQSDIERRINQATASAIKAYNASPSGRALKTSLAGKSMDDIRQVLAQILNSPEFVPVRELVQEHSRVQEQDRGFHIKAISLGVEFSVFILIGGFQGSIGVAVPPHDWTNFEEYVVYLSTSVLVGAGENEFGGVVVGFWNIQPTDLAGPSWGIEVDAGFVDDVVVEASFANSDGSNFIGLSISEGEGEGISAELELSDTWVWGWDEPHVYQVPAANYMIIQSIVCDSAPGATSDEIYFKFTPDGGNTYHYPTQGRFSLNDGQSWNAGRSIYFNDSVTVELFDQDDGNDDPRGSVTYTATNFPYNTTVSENGGKYQINAVLNPTFPSWPTRNKINTIDTSSSGPAACSFQGKFYYVWRAASGSDKLYISGSSDGVTWPAGALLNNVDSTGYAPTAADFGGDLFVFWRGGNNGVYWTSSPDARTPWPNGLRIGSGSTNTPPAACVFNGKFYLFWNDPGMSRIVFSVFDPANRSWSAPQKINDRDSTSDRPSVCAFQNKLYVFWRNSGSGSDNSRIFYSSSDTATVNSWDWGKTINSSEYTGTGPCANVYQGNLFVFFVSNDDDKVLLWTASATGTSWPTNTPTGVWGVTGLPTVTNDGDSQCLAWTDSSKFMWTSRSKT